MVIHPADQAIRDATKAFVNIVTDDPQALSRIHLAVIPGIALQIIATGINATWSGYREDIPRDEQPHWARPLCGALNAGKLWNIEKEFDRDPCANCLRMWHQMYENAGWVNPDKTYRNPRY